MLLVVFATPLQFAFQTVARLVPFVPFYLVTGYKRGSQTGNVNI